MITPKYKFQPFKHKAAFTLAEVLIALTLVGSIAMLLIPTIIKSIPNEKETMSNKAYSVLELAIKTMINNEIDYPADQTIRLASNGITYQKGFNYTYATTNGSTNKFCYLLANSLNTIGTVSCPTTSANGIGTFTTADGMYWTVYIPVDDSTTNSETTTTASTTAVQFPIKSSLYKTLITIDVNGNEGPNCSVRAFSNPTTTACPLGSTPDIFQVSVRYDGKLTRSENINPCPNGVIVASICISGSDESFSSSGMVTADGFTLPNYYAGAQNACGALNMRLPTRAELSPILTDTSYLSTLGISTSSSFYWTSDSQTGGNHNTACRTYTMGSSQLMGCNDYADYTSFNALRCIGDMN